MYKKIFFIFGLGISFLILSVNVIGAQTPDITGLGISVLVTDQNVQNGDVICSDANGYHLCKNEYDSSVLGVVNNSPNTYILSGTTNSQLVISRGETSVRVSSANGSIKQGDYLTTSKIAGVAERATKTGYVVGTALAPYSSSDKTAVGTIKVALNIHANTNVAGAINPTENLVDLLRNGLSGLGSNPIAALRYVLASLMVIVSFVIGFIYFGRIAKAGVEAIGRNPLAGIRIQTSVVLNVVIMLAVIVAGLVIAYLILAI